jgi:hypothetical protein
MIRQIKVGIRFMRETTGASDLPSVISLISLAKGIMPSGLETVNNLFLMKEVFRDAPIADVSKQSNCNNEWLNLA